MSRNFIIILLIATNLATAGFVWKSQKESIERQNIQISPTISPTVTWKVYENKKYNFSLEHPSDWTVNIYNQDGERINIGHDAAYISLRNSKPFELGVPIIKNEEINVGGENTVFHYYYTTVANEFAGYSYNNLREPFNRIFFIISRNQNTEDELTIIKKILASYKPLKN